MSTFPETKFEKECFMCRRTFTSMLSYVKHMGEIHLTEKRCPKCGKRMIRSNKRVILSGKPLSTDHKEAAVSMICERCTYIELFKEEKSDSEFHAA